MEKEREREKEMECHTLLPKIYYSRDATRVDDAYMLEKIPHVYALSLSIWNKYNIHKNYS